MSTFDIDLRLEGQWGALPASRLLSVDDCAIEIPFRFPIDVEEEIGAHEIGVFAHIFYPDLVPQVVDALRNISVKFDLYISTDTPEKQIQIIEGVSSLQLASVTVRVLPNRGRDIGPFLVGFADKIRQHEYVCHLHTKRSPHNSDLAGWRDYTYRQLFGSKEIVSSILYCLKSGEADFLFPQHFSPVVRSLNFGFDFDQMRQILARVGVSFAKDILLEFPSGSMFWARSRSLEKILDLGLELEEFPEEEGQIDGSLAHALERSFLYFVEAAGSRWAKVIRAEECLDKSRLVRVGARGDLAAAVTRVNRRLLGNRVSVGSKMKYYGEVSNVGFRAERSERPRLTLLLPTLRPEKAFGGIVSSIRLFKETQKALGPRVDARVVTLTDKIDLESMISLPDYAIVRLDAHYTELPRTVVDASGSPVHQLPVRKKEVFLATAWWTAITGFRAQEMQEQVFGTRVPLAYFVQDHEPDFYGWSSRSELARSTYVRADDTIAIVNSEELYNYMLGNYNFKRSICFPYEINSELRREFVPVKKEKIILVYGRPSVARNGFESLMDGICLWQQQSPMTARDWKIVSVGEMYESWRAPHVANLTICGKLTLEEYAKLLSRASVGVSLMVSPHPSYPPLEMAEAGVITITNSYANKDLTLRSPNICSIPFVSPEEIAGALESCVERAADGLDRVAEFSVIKSIPCAGPSDSIDRLASIIAEYCEIERT